MNPTSEFTLPAALDPVVAAVMEQLQQNVNAKEQALFDKDAELARSRQALAAAEAIIQQLKEALRLERIRKYGKQSEKLSDLQLELLDREPAVSSEEVETEIASGPLSEERTRTRRVIGRAAAKEAQAASRGATSYPRILSGSKRSSPARPSSAPAASADARLRSSATKRPRCSA